VRSSVVGSGIVHLIVIATLFIVRQSAPLVVPGPDVVQVALMDAPSEVTPPEPKAPEPKPEIEKPDVKPLDESGVKLEKPKPQPKPKPTEKKPEATPPPAMALPSAAVGSAGLSAEVAVDSRNFEFTYYLILVRNKIASNWTPPSGLAGGEAAKAIVYFRIRRDGSVEGAQLETGSNFESFDRSALRAVLVSDPLPPLPLGFGGGDLGVHFGFQYQTP
jgi:protein TonB